MLVARASKRDEQKERIDGENGKLNPNGLVMSTPGQSTRVTRADAAQDEARFGSSTQESGAALARVTRMRTQPVEHSQSGAPARGIAAMDEQAGRDVVRRASQCARRRVGDAEWCEVSNFKGSRIMIERYFARR